MNKHVQFYYPVSKHVRFYYAAATPRLVRFRFLAALGFALWLFFAVGCTTVPPVARIINGGMNAPAGACSVRVVTTLPPVYALEECR